MLSTRKPRSSRIVSALEWYYSPLHSFYSVLRVTCSVRCIHQSACTSTWHQPGLKTVAPIQRNNGVPSAGHYGNSTVIVSDALFIRAAAYLRSRRVGYICAYLHPCVCDPEYDCIFSTMVAFRATCRHLFAVVRDDPSPVLSYTLYVYCISPVTVAGNFVLWARPIRIRCLGRVLLFGQTVTYSV